jgi:hypothetical protein
MRVADGDGAAVLPRDLLDPGELLGDRRGRLIVVEAHGTGTRR